MRRRAAAAAVAAFLAGGCGGGGGSPATPATPTPGVPSKVVVLDASSFEAQVLTPARPSVVEFLSPT